MLYGALPGTLTGQLSVPHQNPGGPSPAARCSAAVTARLVLDVTVAVPPLASTSARPAATVIHDRFMLPPGGVLGFRRAKDPSERRAAPLRSILGRTVLGACSASASFLDVPRRKQRAEGPGATGSSVPGYLGPLAVTGTAPAAPD